MLEQISAQALTILNARVYDAEARASYDSMSGGLFWPDEFPAFGSEIGRIVWKGFLPRYLIAYRASITLGETREEFRHLWEQIETFAPDWPGLRIDRYDKKSLRRLLAAKKLEAECLAEVEESLDND